MVMVASALAEGMTGDSLIVFLGQWPMGQSLMISVFYTIVTILSA